MHKYIKKYFVKVLLALAIVISATLFISQEAYAWYDCKDVWGNPSCTCAPWTSFDGQDWGDQCAGGECEPFCGGHLYEDNWHEIAYSDETKSWLCARWIERTHLMRNWCVRCGRYIYWPYTETIFAWNEHFDYSSTDDGYGYEQHPWDPCQVWRTHTHRTYCICGHLNSESKKWDNFAWWDHCKNVHWVDRGTRNSKYGHSLYCDAHGWINPSTTSAAVAKNTGGNKLGTWDSIEVYYHKWSTSFTNDAKKHYHCDTCGKNIDVEGKLTSTRIDNGKTIGTSNFNTAFDGKWTNSDVKLTTVANNTIKDTSGNTVANNTTLTYEGTNTYYTNATISSDISQRTKNHTVKIDKTAPKLTGTSVRAGTYQTPATTSTAHDSESYGLKVTLKADDSNANARGGANDVAKIKEAYVIVRDKDNANNSKRYNIDGVADKVSIDTSKVIDVNKDFHGVLDFVYEIHVIDYAGNDAVKTDTIIRNPEVFLSVKNVTQNTQLNGSNVFLGGEHGILTITTTGYCDISNLKWNNYTLNASEKDQEQNYPTMIYNTSVNMTPPNSDKSGFVGKNYIQLMDKDICYSTDSYTPDGGYTRIYEFRFWVPFNHEWTTDNGSKPYIDKNNKYPIEVTAVNNKYNRSATKSTLYKLVSGKITDKFRSSLVF